VVALVYHDAFWLFVYMCLRILLTHLLEWCVQCFDAVGCVAGRAFGLYKQSVGVLVWLSVWSKVQTCIWPSWCHCHSLYLASVKSRVVLPFWYWLTWVVPEKGPLNGCVCVTWVLLLLLLCLFSYIWWTKRLDMSTVQKVSSTCAHKCPFPWWDQDPI